jgi:hypothetical protein
MKRIRFTVFRLSVAYGEDNDTLALKFLLKRTWLTSCTTDYQKRSEKQHAEDPPSSIWPVRVISKLTSFDTKSLFTYGPHRLIRLPSTLYIANLASYERSHRDESHMQDVGDVSFGSSNMGSLSGYGS